MNFGITILYLIMSIYMAFLSISIFLSWIPALDNYAIFRWIRKIADWYLRPFRGVIVLGSIDFTPWIGIGIYTFIVGLFAQL